MTSPPAQLPDETLARSASLPMKPAPVVLTGAHVELVPLDVARDVDELFAISSGAPCQLGARRVEAYDADAVIWRWMFRGPYPNVVALAEELSGKVAAPDGLPFVVRDRASGRALGVATYLSNRPADLKVELGSIWYSPIAQGTGASREATHLLCQHAFGLGYRRVEWKCDARNLRSRRAARAYGFTFEGVQDSHMIVKGDSRDTAWFRMLDRDWPRVQAVAAVAIARASAPTDDVRALIGELEDELAAGYSPEQRHGLSLDALFEPHVRFFLAHVGGAAVGCGGVALLDGFAEAKRMYVRPTARGLGVADALLHRLESTARDAGLAVLRLETGDVQHAATRFYQRAGFRRCPAFGAYTAMAPSSVATSVFYEKRLD